MELGMQTTALRLGRSRLSGLIINISIDVKFRTTAGLKLPWTSLGSLDPCPWLLMAAARMTMSIDNESNQVT